MREEIYTIPVTEAFDKGGECPFCTLHKKLEGDILDLLMGPSYMEQDVRAETDRYGFCKEHYRQMFGARNRLGLALILETHWKKINHDMKSLLDAERLSSKKKRKLFQASKEDSPLCNYVDTLEGTCYACMRMENRMKNYLDTFFHLFKTEPAFKTRILESKGFCLEHFRDILKEGKRQMRPSEYQALCDLLIPLQKENFKRIEEDLSWFIQKFDYRFEDAPWKNSKDAVERGILKVAAWHPDDAENAIE